MLKFTKLIAATSLRKDDINLISKGNTIAFRRFYDQYFQRVWNNAKNFTRKREICEEIVSDVFTSIWLNKEKLPEVENIDAYLFIVTRNKAFNFFEKEMRQPKATEDFSSENEIEKNNPEDILITKELTKAIQHSIDQLPERCRIIFQMSRNEKLTHQRIAEILSISENTVHAQMVTALRKMHNSLRNYLYLFL